MDSLQKCKCVCGTQGLASTVADNLPTKFVEKLAELWDEKTKQLKGGREAFETVWNEFLEEAKAVVEPSPMVFSTAVEQFEQASQQAKTHKGEQS